MIGLNTTDKQAVELLSLNTNGIRNDKNRRSLFHWLKKHYKADDKIVLLQETHASVDIEKLWHNDWGHRNIIFSHGTNRSRGVAIILPKNYDYVINNEVCDNEGRHIALDITIDGNRFWILNCYAPTSDFPVQQLEWLKKIQTLIEQASDMNIIIGGDLNDYFIPHLDKYNAKANLPETEYVKAWKATCSEINLTDIWRTLNPDVRRYTWRQGRTAATLKQSRLDYWVISNHLIYNLKSVEILPGFRSDHSLIEIKFNGSEESDRGPSYWRFSANLLTNLEYVTYMNNRIDEIINKHTGIENAGLKWDVIKMEIRSSTVCFSKKLAKEKRDNISNTIQENIRLNKLLETEINDKILQEIEITKSEIEQYNNEKADGILLRSKADWAESGEKNTKFFLNLEKRNYKNKCITKLVDEQEQELTNSDKILEYEADYYKRLYSEPNVVQNMTNDDLFLSETTPKIEDEKSNKCEEDITLQEIGCALKELKNGKSPGTDGFTPDFYKFFWTKLKTLVLNSLLCVHTMGELSTEQKRGIINLIPKKDKDVRLLKNWRPISLLNTDYKILTKCLATRLKKVLPDVINEDQVAYLKDRFIGQNIRAIIDIMEFTKSNQIPGIVAFLDFEKAFDTVNWNVIQKTLEIFGFKEQFRAWVKAIYKNSEACVTNNGFSSPFFKLQRGVRQGCPLSAYLFIMVVELLANKIRETREIKGIKIGDFELKILQMADDTTVFVEDVQSLRKILEIIECFHLFAGLKLNKSKTEAMWLGSWNECTQSPLGLTWVKHVHSLGIFFSYDTDCVVQKNFTDKLKSFTRILDLWSQRDLSLIGKIAILKSLAFSLITYQCCSLEVPEDFIETVNSYAFKFLWNGKPEKIKRKTIIGDYTKGGLKMLDIKSFTTAQKVMWVRRLIKSKKASWKAYPEYILKTLIGMDSFKTQLNTTANKNNTTPFYWNILKEWAKMTTIVPETLDVIGIRRQYLWLNKYILINKKEIKWKGWIDKGIMIIHDILNEQGDFLTMQELEGKYNIKCNFLSYNSLKDAIPKLWRTKVKTMQVPTNVINNKESPYIQIDTHQINAQLITNKLIYWKIINNIFVSPITKDKWIQELALDENTWESYFEISKVISDTKIRVFQYKVLFNLTPCNLYLFRIGKRANCICNFCNLTDNIAHYFYVCQGTQSFWSGFENWWNMMETDTLVINKKLAMLGTLEKGKLLERLNALLLLARWYIYTSKQIKAEEPFMYKFLCQLKYKLKIERMIALRKGSMDHFEIIWGSVETYLD